MEGHSSVHSAHITNDSPPDSIHDLQQHEPANSESARAWRRRAKAIHFKQVIEERLGVDSVSYLQAIAQNPFSYARELAADERVLRLRKIKDEVTDKIGSSETPARGGDTGSIHMVRYSIMRDTGVQFLLPRFATMVAGVASKSAGALVHGALWVLRTMMNALCFPCALCLRRRKKKIFGPSYGGVHPNACTGSTSSKWGTSAPSSDAPEKSKYDIIKILGTLSSTEIVEKEKLYKEATIMDLVISRLKNEVVAEIVAGVYMVRRQASMDTLDVDVTFVIQKYGFCDRDELRRMIRVLTVVQKLYRHKPSNVTITLVGGEGGYYLAMASDAEEISMRRSCDCEDGWGARVKTLTAGPNIFCTDPELRPCMSCQATTVKAFVESSASTEVRPVSGKIVVSGKEVREMNSISSSDFTYKDNNIPSMEDINNMMNSNDLRPSANILRSWEIAVTSPWRVLILLMMLAVCMIIPGLASLIDGEGFSLAAVLAGLLGAPATAVVLLSLVTAFKHGINSKLTEPTFLTRRTVQTRKQLSSLDEDALQSPSFMFLILFDRQSVISRDEFGAYLRQDHERSDKKPILLAETEPLNRLTSGLAITHTLNREGQSIWLDVFEMKVSKAKQEGAVIHLNGWKKDIDETDSLQKGIEYVPTQTQVSRSADHTEGAVGVKVFEEGQ